jgi:hypothetical protein
MTFKLLDYLCEPGKAIHPVAALCGCIDNFS